jgi:hypothetical protein
VVEKKKKKLQFDKHLPRRPIVSSRPIVNKTRSLFEMAIRNEDVHTINNMKQTNKRSTSSASRFLSSSARCFSSSRRFCRCVANRCESHIVFVFDCLFVCFVFVFCCSFNRCTAITGVRRRKTTTTTERATPRQIAFATRLDAERSRTSSAGAARASTAASSTSNVSYQ